MIWAAAVDRDKIPGREMASRTAPSCELFLAGSGFHTIYLLGWQTSQLMSRTGAPVQSVVGRDQGWNEEGSGCGVE